MNAPLLQKRVQTLQNVQDTLNDARSRAYSPHCFTFGKTMRDNNPYGKILLRYDHQRTGQTEGFPEDLEPLCRLQNLIPGWVDTSTSINSPIFDRFAFALRSVRTTQGRGFHLFCKIACWPEDGNNKSSRVFSHLNVWAFEFEEFNILASLPIIWDLFLSKSNEHCYKFSVPITESLMDPLSMKRIPLGPLSWPESWLLWADFFRNEEFQSVAHAAAKGDSAPIESLAHSVDNGQPVTTEMLDELMFLCKTISHLSNHFENYEVDPQTLNFTWGITPTSMAQAQGIVQY